MSVATFIFKYVSPVTAVVILVLNVLEVVYILHPRTNLKYSKPMIFLVNLSIADSLVGLNIIMVKVVYFLNMGTKAIMFVQYYVLRLSLFASVFNLLAVTFVRLLAIKRPFKVQRVKKHMSKMCIATWLLSVLVVSALYFPLQFSLTSTDFDQYEVAIFPLSVYPAIVIFALSYLAIMRRLNKQNIRISTSTSAPSSSNEISQEISQNNHSMTALDPAVGKTTLQKQQATDNKSRDTRSNKRIEKKVFHIALQSIIALVICWFPLATYSVVKMTGALRIWTHMRDLEYCLFTMAFLNSVVDPILFFVSMRR